MKWDSSLETGIPVVDKQHQSLFRQVDSLFDRSNANRVKENLDFLARYVIEHFRTEEFLQRASGFPATFGHKKLHDNFILALRNLQAEYEADGNGMLILMKVTKTAVDWLNEHIKGADKEFAEHCKASGFVGGALDNQRAG